MDALLSAFVFALFAELGDKTQLLVVALAARYARLGQVLAGVAIAAAANAAIAATAGVVVHDLVVPRAMSLLVALALIFAGSGGFFRQKTPDMGATWRVGAFVTTLVCFFLLEFGDKTQFATFALAARFDSLGLAAAGATAGVIAASVPAVLAGEALVRHVALRPVRIAIGAAFLLIGCVVAVSALELI